jgi:hypothetical protein
MECNTKIGIPPRHGGDIKVSPDSVGACFWLELPKIVAGQK